MPRTSWLDRAYCRQAFADVWPQTCPNPARQRTNRVGLAARGSTARVFRSKSSDQSTRPLAVASRGGGSVGERSDNRPTVPRRTASAPRARPISGTVPLDGLDVKGRGTVVSRSWCAAGARPASLVGDGSQEPPCDPHATRLIERASRVASAAPAASFKRRSGAPSRRDFPAARSASSETRATLRDLLRRPATSGDRPANGEARIPQQAETRPRRSRIPRSFWEDSQLNVYRGELEVRPPGAPTTARPAGLSTLVVVRVQNAG